MSVFENHIALNEIIADFSRNIAISYSKGYGKTFIDSFMRYKSIRMAAGFACKWFEREFSETLEMAPDFSEYVSKLNLNERDKGLLKRTLRMIFILRK